MFNTLTRMGASGASDYEIERSLRFNSGDSPELTRTPSGAGSVSYTHLTLPTNSLV